MNRSLAARPLPAVTALAGLAVAAAMLAGAQARLMGRVTDTEGNPIEGATVTVTTPNLGTFKLTLTTDRKGQYGTIIADATMPYHLKFEKEGYAAFEGDKKIPVGETGGIDAKLRKASEAQPAAAPPPSPGDAAVAAYNEGVDLLNAGKTDAAEKKFLEAVRKNPDLPAPWKALTIIAYNRKDWAHTLEYGDKATELDPSLSTLYAMMAEAARQSGDKKAAAEWEARNAEANPDKPETLYNKGIEAYNQNRMKDAEVSLSRAIQVRPDYALAHFWLGMAQINLKKSADAKSHFQKYLKLDPKGSEAETAREMLSVLK
jgi:tetratricopeptide (TPR) repeat protein